MSNLKTQVWVTLQVEGLHNWPGCPFEEVSYLKDLHRHMFHVKAYKLVTHSDRDVEFIMLKHRIQEFLRERYFRTPWGCHLFGAKSCEMIAEELIRYFDLTQCEVSEDGENGAIVTVDDVLSTRADTEGNLTFAEELQQGFKELARIQAILDKHRP